MINKLQTKPLSIPHNIEPTLKIDIKNKIKLLFLDFKRIKKKIDVRIIGISR